MGNKSSIPSHHPGRPPQKPFRKWERAMLKRTFEDLSARSVSGKTIDKETFLRFFCNVPGMLGERLFFVFNTKKTGEIDFEEFTQGIALYCRGSLEQKIEFVFRMFNLKGDGRVGKSELETMLNSFVFAAETIVSGRENEQSVIRKDDNHTSKERAAGFPPPLLPVPSSIASGYRAFNVLGIDEDTEGDTSDNEPPNSASSNGRTSSTNTSRQPVKPKKPTSSPGSHTAPAGSIFQALNAVKGLQPPNLSSGTTNTSSAASLDPNYPFHSTLPPRRQSLPQAHSLMHSSSQPTHITHPPGQQHTSHLTISSSQAGGSHPLPPSTPPPSSNILHPYQQPSPFPFASAALNSSSNKFATPTHASSGSLDFSSDDSSKRINHMVEVAMKIARKGEGRASENGGHYVHQAPALLPSASVGTITPATKRVSDRQLSSPAEQSDHPPFTKSSSSRSTDGPLTKPIDKESKDKDKDKAETNTGSGTTVTTGGDHRDSRDTRHDREPELSFYLFATWIQEFPEVLQVLDLAFAGKQQTENHHYSATPSLKDDNLLLSTPPHNEKKDLSVPLDRLHSTDTHLLGNLMAQLKTSSKKAKNSPHSSSHLHGRTFSVTSLISPHLPSKDGHSHASSIGTDVVIDQRKQGLEVKCEQCGWEVDIRHCYACGKKVTITSQSSPKLNNHQLNNPTLGAANNNLNVNASPISGSIASAQVHSTGASASSAAASSSSSSPSFFSLICDKCGILFLGGHLQYCVQCGFDMMKTGLKIEPPLVKSLSWQRKQARGHVMEGHLQKVGKTLRNIVTRWYVIRDNFMYTYSKQHDVKPSHVLFLEGCFVEAVNHEEKNAKLKFGMEIILNEEMHKSRLLYCTSASQRQQWIEAIRYHANVHSVDDYYNIGEELGVGRFSSVRVAVSKSSGKQYAIKIIDKNDIDEKEKEALRTEVAVLKLLNHPHIIKCKNVFETRKQMFIVMTFVRGGDLFDRLLRKKKFTEAMTQKIMYDLFSVVQYLHLRGIVHNDLKPENIMMATEEDDSEIIIGDFGLSKFANEQERLSMPCGTLAYVAPEVLTGTGYGKEVDLWSCGVIMYLLLSGSLPFDSHVREEIIEKTIAGRIPFPATPWNTVSEEAKSLIRGLLCIDVERRLTCAQALRHPWFRCRWNEAGERLTEGIGMGNMANMAMIGGILPPIPSLMEEPEGRAHSESSAPPSPATLLISSNNSTNSTNNNKTSSPAKHLNAKQPSDSSSISTNNPNSMSNNPSNALNPPTHLYFSSSPAGDAAVDVDSSRERDIDTEAEPDIEEESSESKEEEADDLDAEDDPTGLGFRSRFINPEDDDSPAESPSHSR